MVDLIYKKYSLEQLFEIISELSNLDLNFILMFTVGQNMWQILQKHLHRYHNS